MRKLSLRFIDWRWGAIRVLGVACVLALCATGCTSTDPFTMESLRTLKADHEALINEYNDKVDPDLDPDFVKSELGAYDDLMDYERSKSK